VVGRSFELAKYVLLQLQLLRCGFDDQIDGGTFFQVRSATNVLQRAVAIVFGQLRELDSFGQVPFNRPDPTRQRLAIDVMQLNPKTRSRGDLGDTMAHCAGANHGNCLDRWQTAPWAAHVLRTGLESVLNHPLTTRSHQVRPFHCS
jgi:hypothetical protein